MPRSFFLARLLRAATSEQGSAGTQPRSAARRALLLLCLLPLTMCGQGIAGTWEFTTVSRDATAEIEETQRTLRTFAPDGTLTETIFYAEQARTSKGETYVLRYRSALTGKWKHEGTTLLLSYKPRTLRLTYEGITFPERDEAVQALLQAEMEDSLGRFIPRQAALMEADLRDYYAATPHRRLEDVSIEGDLLFVRTADGRRAFRRIKAPTPSAIE